MSQGTLHHSTFFYFYDTGKERTIIFKGDWRAGQFSKNYLKKLVAGAITIVMSVVQNSYLPTSLVFRFFMSFEVDTKV